MINNNYKIKNNIISIFYKNQKIEKHFEKEIKSNLVILIAL